MWCSIWLIQSALNKSHKKNIKVIIDSVNNEKSKISLLMDVTRLKKYLCGEPSLVNWYRKKVIWYWSPSCLIALLLNTSYNKILMIPYLIISDAWIYMWGKTQYTIDWILCKTLMLIWDEALMAYKCYFEAPDINLLNRLEPAYISNS